MDDDDCCDIYNHSNAPRYSVRENSSYNYTSNIRQQLPPIQRAAIQPKAAAALSPIAVSSSQQLQWPFSKESIIKVPVGIKKSAPRSFLVGTGSDISYIKADKLTMPFQVNHRETLTIYRYLSASVESLGTATVDLCFGKKRIKHLFHIIPDYAGLHVDGVLGCDFVHVHVGSIDFGSHIITIRAGN